MNIGHKGQVSVHPKGGWQNAVFHWLCKQIQRIIQACHRFSMRKSQMKHWTLDSLCCCIHLLQNLMHKLTRHVGVYTPACTMLIPVNDILGKIQILKVLLCEKGAEHALVLAQGILVATH